MKSLNYVTVKDTANRNTTNSVILHCPVSLMRILPVLNQVENGKPLRKTNLSRYWDIFFVSFAPDYGSKWHRLGCTLQKSPSLLQKAFLSLLKVYSCSRLLHWHHSMFRASLDATSMCFQRRKHSSRRRHRKNIRLHSNQQFYSFGDCNVCRSLHSCCFSPLLSP